MARTIVQEFTKGLWDEIPPFRLVLGLCPTLAVTKTVANGVGMGVAAVDAPHRHQREESRLTRGLQSSMPTWPRGKAPPW